MEVRDAVEADAERLAELTDAPVDVMGNLVHDRTVRVAETDASDGAGAIVAFVSFDARRETVHVTQFDGTPAACERLLEEPIRFARTENMAVELLVGAARDGLQSAAEAVGFERAGDGPAFEGTPTVRFRREAGTDR